MLHSSIMPLYFDEDVEGNGTMLEFIHSEISHQHHDSS